MVKFKVIYLGVIAAITSGCGAYASAAENGTVIFKDANNGITTEAISYGPSVVRIVKYKDTKTPEKKSYSIIANPSTGFSANNNGYSSDCFSIKADMNGDIVFLKNNGDTLLVEKGYGISEAENSVDRGKFKVYQQFSLDKKEVIVGLGQRQCPKLNQRGEKVRIWSGNTNITIPYFASEKGYGLYWDNAGESYFEDSEEGTSFTSLVAPSIDYYFIYRDGTQDGVIASIRELTGQATMFPLWTLGHWQCRERYKSSDELCNVLDRYRELEIPLDGIVQDWQYWGCDSNWNAMSFMNPHYINKMGDEKWMKYLPNDERPTDRYPEPRIKTPQEMVDYVHAHNAHLMISIWASFGPWTRQYIELKKINALLPFDTWPRNQGVMPYDAYNPKARDIYWKYLKNLYNMGFDAWWTDSTEPDHFEHDGDSDYMTYDGSWRSVKNAFPLLTNKGIYEHQRATKGNAKRSVQMTRCGAFGIQHYGTFSWSGDVVSNWDVMKNQIPSGLNYVMCGIPFWNTDIGGFFGWDYNNDCKNPALQELQVRWMQWGCFMPLMRNHCSSPLINELYEWGKPGEWAYDAQKKFIELRYRLLPYIYSMAGNVVQNSGSMMRPFIMDFANDSTALTINDEYMFGKAIMVKPVTDPLYTYVDEKRNGHAIYPEVEKAGAPVNVYLPTGCQWYDFWSNEVVDGGRRILTVAPIDRIPLYIKAGSIIAFGPKVQYSNEKPWDNLEIRVYPGQDGTFTLYEDEGDSYNYEKGAFTTIDFNWDDAKRELSISARKGSYNGMLTGRKFSIIVMDNNKTPGDTAPESFDKVIDYNGEAVSVKL
jgi:alpha-D-xyloside xylohydrolase